MRCPVDKNHMIIVEHERIELDYCPKCMGIWFDARELDLLITVLKSKGFQVANQDLLIPHQAEVSEAKRKCPICRRNMDKVWLGKNPKVLIDSCPIGDGLWFDGGELNSILCQLPEPQATGSKDVISFLNSAFPVACNPVINTQNKK